MWTKHSPTTTIKSWKENSEWTKPEDVGLVCKSQQHSCISWKKTLRRRGDFTIAIGAIQLFNII